MEKKTSKEKRPRMKLGEMLLKYNLITEAQMNAALKSQETMGGRLGRNLISLNYISEDVFIKFLATQLNISSININKVIIPPEVQKLVPLDMMQKIGVLPVKKEGNTLWLGMTDPTDLNILKELEFSLGSKIVPSVLAESQWEYAMRFFERNGWAKLPLRKSDEQISLSSDYDLAAMMRELVARKGSDIHLTVGVQPTIRVSDQLIRMDTPPITRQKMEQLLEPIISPGRREHLKKHSEIDYALSFKDIGRFRINVYRQRGNFAASFRYVSDRIPSLKELVLPQWLTDYALKKQGLILVTGPTGHGKSTTMACLVDIINSKKRVNIITLEDPIEYVHRHKMSNVNQREIGADTASFKDGIKYIFRQDPDVVVIGEMRDLESISTALTAAETGHLVLATLHTQNAVSTIHRIIDVFPGHQQNQIRHQLADSLLLILSQRLVPRADGQGRVLAYEKLSNSYRTQNAIRESRTHLIRSQATFSSEDFISIEQTLAELFKRKMITYEEGLKFAEDHKMYESLTGGK